MSNERTVNEQGQKKPNGKKIRKALVASMLALTLATPSASQSLRTSDAASKPTIIMYGQKNVTTYTGDSIKLGKVVGKYKGKKLAKKKLKVTVKKESISYPAIANKIKNNKPVTFNSTGTYDVKYKFTSPAKTTKTATRQITVLDSSSNNNNNKNNVEPKKDCSISYTDKFSNLGKFRVVKYDGISYYVLDGTKESVTDFIEYDDNNRKVDQKYDLYFSKYPYTNIVKDNVIDNYEFLSYFGKVRVIDEYGIDCSNNLFFYIIPNPRNEVYSIYVYFFNSKNEFVKVNGGIRVYNNYNKYKYEFYGNDAYVAPANDVCLELFEDERVKKGEMVKVKKLK